MLIVVLATFRPDPPPKFALKTIDGSRFSNESLKGKVVLLQFWTTWGQFCRGDQPAVDKVMHDYADKGLVVLAVNVGEPRETVRQYLAESPRTCDIVLNTDTNLPATFHARSFPLYVLIDREGRVAGKQHGAGGEDALRQLLQKAGL